MKDKEFITIAQLAKMLGISRIAVYKRVKKGQIKAIKAGKAYLIPGESVKVILKEKLSQQDKDKISSAVKKTVEEYGDVLKMLGNE
ncbi:MAG: helix-turn-helix domain-containing protein [Candidatus Omnitrophota bacterium]